MDVFWKRRIMGARRRRRRQFTGFGYVQSQVEAIFIPGLAFLVFLCIQPFAQNLIDGHPREKTKDKQSSKNAANQVYPKDAFSQHGVYITDDDIAFRREVVGCDPSTKFSEADVGSSTVHRKRPIVNFDAIFLICSAVQNTEGRQILRFMYSNYSNTRPYRIKTVFLVGLPTNSSVQSQVDQESLNYGDVLQGNFVDHYFNLTYKTIMGYHWAQLYCRDVRLVLKIDDDVFVDVFRFFDYFLPTISVRQRVIYGYLNDRPRVHRQGKYQVGEGEFSGQRYPEFCSGFFVVPTRDVVDSFFEVAKTVRYFRLEDVFTYALVRQAMVDVQLVHLDVITHEWLKYRDCVDTHKYRCKYFAVELFPNQLLEYHNRSLEHRRKLGLLGGPFL